MHTFKEQFQSQLSQENIWHAFNTLEWGRAVQEVHPELAVGYKELTDDLEVKEGSALIYSMAEGVHLPDMVTGAFDTQLPDHIKFRVKSLDNSQRVDVVEYNPVLEGYVNYGLAESRKQEGINLLVVEGQLTINGLGRMYGFMKGHLVLEAAKQVLFKPTLRFLDNLALAERSGAQN